MRQFGPIRRLFTASGKQGNLTAPALLKSYLIRGLAQTRRSSRAIGHWSLIIMLGLFLISLPLAARKKAKAVPKKKKAAVTRVSIPAAVKKFAADPDLKHAGISFLAVGPKGNTLYAYQSDRSLVPASVLKLLTTGAALGMLGEEYRFKTRLATTGKTNGHGVLKGNLYIIGGGDPTLGSGRWSAAPGPDTILRLWAEIIKAAGIKKIEGAIIAETGPWESHRPPDGWLWSDLGNYYGATPSGLNYNENLYRLKVEPGKKSGDPVKVLGTEPQMDGVQFDLRSFSTGPAGSGDNACIYSAPGIGKYYIKGTVPAGLKSFSVKGAMQDPAATLAQAFSRVLNEEGIPVRSNTSRTAYGWYEEIPDSVQVIYTHNSPPLREIAYYTNLKSINLYAEQLLRSMALATKRAATAEGGTTAMQEWWKQMGMRQDGLFLIDGCGLSLQNGVTAGQMVKALQIASKQPWFPEFYSSLPVAGVSGSMTNMGKGTPIAGKMHAKTGHISRVRSYAGYMPAKGGGYITFAFLVNNYNCSSAEIKEKIEKVLVSIRN